jgi:arabinose-5-phosphate isomerase
VSTSTNALAVKDVLLPPERIAVVPEQALFKEALEEMQRRRLGIACVVDNDRRLLGIITDGDVRRMLLKDQKPFAALFADDALLHAVRRPTVVAATDRLVDAVTVMEEKGIWDLPVVDDQGRLLGLLHLHPAIKVLLGL